MQELLDQNEISQALVASRTGLSTKHINQVVRGRVPLSIEVAVLIEHAFPKIKAFPLLMAQLRLDVAKAKDAVRRHAENEAKDKTPLPKSVQR